MHKQFLQWSVAAVLFTFTQVSFGQLQPLSLELSCKHVFPIEQSYLSKHVTYKAPSKNLEARTVDQFIKKLDPSKLYFLNKDIAEIKMKMNNIFDKTRERDCTGIQKAHELFIKRVKERVDYAKKYLGPKFKFNSNVEINLDSDHRKYPNTLPEANNYHEKYIQFQVSNYLATDLSLEESKQQVSRNYDRALKKLEEIKTTDLLAIYLDSFARSLDPHSSYLSADALEDFEIQMRLSLDGIGATLSSQDGFTVIEDLIAGGAASRSGELKRKDKIIAVGQGDEGIFENVIEMDLRDVVRLIRGKKGTKVRLTILRKEGKDTKRFMVSLIRDSIKLEDEAVSITYHDKTVNGVKKKIGLVNLPSFYADTRQGGRSAATDLKKVLAEAKKEKVDGLILDMSTNGGGSLDDAVKIAGLFFKTGNVVKQSSRDGAKEELELADEDQTVDYAGPLVVLTSRISASASEIVAGTLKDYKRAVILGSDHTFGKGSVQSVEPLPRGLGALKTTVGMFFTPGGNSTQHRGVDSDILFPSIYATDDIGEKTLDYSLPPKKIKDFTSPGAYVTAGEDAWRPVDKGLIDRLNKKSQKRVAQNEEFQKITKDLKKVEKRGKIIKLSEVLKEKEDAKKKDLAKTGKNKKDGEDKDRILTREEKKEEYFKRPDIQEALNVSADMIAETSNVPMTIAKDIKGDSAKKEGHEQTTSDSN